jgi:hypothetical protein
MGGKRTVSVICTIMLEDGKWGRVTTDWSRDYEGMSLSAKERVLLDTFMAVWRDYGSVAEELAECAQRENETFEETRARMLEHCVETSSMVEKTLKKRAAGKTRKGRKPNKTKDFKLVNGGKGKKGR